MCDFPACFTANTEINRALDESWKLRRKWRKCDGVDYWGSIPSFGEVKKKRLKITLVGKIEMPTFILKAPGNQREIGNRSANMQSRLSTFLPSIEDSSFS